MRTRLWRRLAVSAFMGLGLLAAGCAPAANGRAMAGPAPALTQVIQPMTNVTEHPRQGYFSDPYPIHVATSHAAAIPQSFSGTTTEVLSCAGKPTAGCFHASQITVKIGSALRQQAATNGSTLGTGINNNIFQDDSGAWHMAVTYYVSNRKHHPNARAWTAILHAHPVSTPGTTVPTSWVADSLLIGSFTSPTKANYDGKYFENAGKLYLVYSNRLPGTPARDGIVAQLMSSPEHVAPAPPAVLLAPGDYNSELFFGLHQPNTFKLIETGNITKIDGKYVMAYSTGAYDEPDYKTGLAWSDTFLPDPGDSYRKITMPDTAGVWGKAGHPEVRYLLQSQEPHWPNDIGRTVVAPGVPAVIQDAQRWYLTFAGYLPSDAPVSPKTGHYAPSSRRPFFAALSVHIPAEATVAHASDAELAHWITIDASR
ncbi:MAG: hypothetical protein ACRDR6_24110 [Pseudonocardiaceae bacterium]